VREQQPMKRLRDRREGAGLKSPKSPSDGCPSVALYKKSPRRRTAEVSGWPTADVNEALQNSSRTKGFTGTRRLVDVNKPSMTCSFPQNSRCAKGPLNLPANWPRYQIHPGQQKQPARRLFLVIDIEREDFVGRLLPNGAGAVCRKTRPCVVARIIPQSTA